MSTNVEFPIGFSSGSSKEHSGLNEQPAQPLTGEEGRVSRNPPSRRDAAHGQQNTTDNLEPLIYYSRVSWPGLLKPPGAAQ